METTQLIDAGWYFIEYFRPELTALAVGAVLALTALWLLVTFKAVDRVR